jgi:hypothetical protein
MGKRRWTTLFWKSKRRVVVNLPGIATRSPNDGCCISPRIMKIGCWANPPVRPVAWLTCRLNCLMRLTLCGRTVEGLPDRHSVNSALQWVVVAPFLSCRKLAGGQVNWRSSGSSSANFSKRRETRLSLPLVFPSFFGRRINGAQRPIIQSPVVHRNKICGYQPKIRLEKARIPNPNQSNLVAKRRTSGSTH